MINKDHITGAQIIRRLSSIQINDGSYPGRDGALKLINEFYPKALEAQNAISALITKLNVSTAVSEAHEKTEYAL